VTKDDDQRSAQYGCAVFSASQAVVIDKIAGDTNHEKTAA
jgi:hypothetical protein